MLSKKDNETLTQIGPDTLMGNMLRRFWMPACLSEQLPGPGCDPLRVRLLGEDLIAIRDGKGEVGILDEYCAHRTASLALGRMEPDGVRCIYHGWKFAADGTLLEAPNNPDPAFCKRVKQPAYPTREAGGMVWCYMGPRDKMPELPIMPWMAIPDENRFIFRVDLNANFVQVMEASYDSSHVGILHQDGFNDRLPASNFTDKAPALDFHDAPFGFYYGATRKLGDADKKYVRVTPFAMPFYNMTPDNGQAAGLYLPIDDEHCSWIIVTSSWDGAPIDRERILDGFGLIGGHLPDGAYTLNGEYKATKQNRYFQNRESMRSGKLFSGLDGFFLQDGGMVMSMGPIANRTKENLVPADAADVRIRRLYLESARLVAEGGDPIGWNPPVDYTKVNALGITIPTSERWQDHLPDVIKASQFEMA
jgi:phthalate 4,5-dioxygenase